MGGHNRWNIISYICILPGSNHRALQIRYRTSFSFCWLIVASRLVVRENNNNK